MAAGDTDGFVPLNPTLCTIGILIFLISESNDAKKVVVVVERERVVMLRAVGRSHEMKHTTD
jgi:hypothetical protein